MLQEFIKNNCLVCKGSSIKLLFNGVVHTCGVREILGIENNPTSDVLQCEHCGHAFLSPSINEILIDKYYNLTGSEYYDEKEVVNSRYHQNEYIYKLVHGLKKQGKVLEIGCGNGFLLERFKKSGYNCFGVEPSPLASKHAVETFGLNVVNGVFDNTTFLDKTFDIILLIDVIEHLYNPNQLLEQLNRVLDADGILVILTGNVCSLNAKIWREKWFYFYSWEHISFFNYNSIKYLLEKNNLKLDKYLEVSHTGSLSYNIFRLWVLNPLMYLYNFWIKKKYKHISLAYDHMIVLAKKNDEHN